MIFKDRDFVFSDIGHLMINIEYTIDGTYITVPTTTTGGQLIRYVRDTFSQLEVETERS